MPPTQLALVSWVAWVAWALGFSGGVASFPCTHATRASVLCASSPKMLTLPTQPMLPRWLACELEGFGFGFWWFRFWLVLVLLASSWFWLVFFFSPSYKAAGSCLKVTFFKAEIATQQFLWL